VGRLFEYCQRGAARRPRSGEPVRLRDRAQRFAHHDCAAQVGAGRRFARGDQLAPVQPALQRVARREQVRAVVALDVVVAVDERLYQHQASRRRGSAPGLRPEAVAPRGAGVSHRLVPHQS